MKKLLAVSMSILMTISLAACGGGATGGNNAQPAAPAAPAQSNEAPADAGNAATGKVAIVTNTVSQNEEEYRSAQDMVEKYGSDKIRHETWPDNFSTEQEQMVSILTNIASDDNVKALVINQAVGGTNAAVDKFLELRDDVLIIYCTPGENPPDVAARADIVLIGDELAMGYTIPVQAKAMGATKFVHYSFPRHMSYPLLAQRRDIFREKCAEIGLEFIDATAPDPTGDMGTPGAQQFILEDVPKMVAQYGKDTAFFSTNCSMQTPLIKSVLDNGAIYPQPCCPSPLHGFPSALGIELSDDQKGDLDYVIEQVTAKVAEGGGTGRFSTWPVPVSMMFTVAGTEYAIKWMAGETNGKLDKEVLNQAMNDYAGTDISLDVLVEDGKTLDNYILTLVDFITF